MEGCEQDMAKKLPWTNKVEGKAEDTPTKKKLGRGGLAEEGPFSGANRMVDSPE